MGSGGSSSGMGIAGPSSGNFPPGAYGDAVSWGQVAASGKTPPPPPPPQPATAVEEWPELGAGPGPAAAAGPSSVGSGKVSNCCPSSLLRLFLHSTLLHLPVHRCQGLGVDGCLGLD